MTAVPKVVLIVDDEPDHVELIRRAFRLQAPDTILLEAPTLSDAKRLLAHGEPKPQLVLADLQLPDGEGTALIDAVPEIPVVILTGRGSEVIAVEALRSGAADYVVKSPAALAAVPERSARIFAHWAGKKEREAMAVRLQESEERYALAVNGSNDAIWDWRLDGDELFVSERWCAISGYEPRQFSRMEQLRVLIHPEDFDEFQVRLQRHLCGDSPHFEHELRVRSASGEYRWILARGLAVRDASGKAYRMAGSLTEITERKRIEQQLLYNAFHDALTGLYNRGMFLERLEQRLRSCRQSAFAVAMLDFNRFRFVNEFFGHAGGDVFLVSMARRLITAVRPQDLAARWGGDEFAVILEDLRDVGEARAMGQEIFLRLREPVPLNGRSVYPGVSIGIAFLNASSGRAEDVLRAAGEALLRAKASGGVCCVEEKDSPLAGRRRLELEHDLRRALVRREFHLHYQPIISMTTGEVFAFEALLRWNRPGHGQVGAKSFVSLAEDFGLIEEIDSWVLEETARQRKSSSTLFGNPFRVSVNLSAPTLCRPGLGGRLAELPAISGADDWLNIEITERSLIKEFVSLSRELPRLEKLRIGLWLDDFGTGYSSLAYLARLPLQMIKIDRSFVTRMSSHRELAVIKAVVSLAGALGITVTAEGVESVKQLEVLRDLGCAYGQGYYFSQPLCWRRAVGSQFRKKLAPLAPRREAAASNY